MSITSHIKDDIFFFFFATFQMGFRNKISIKRNNYLWVWISNNTIASKCFIKIWNPLKVRPGWTYSVYNEFLISMNSAQKRCTAFYFILFLYGNQCLENIQVRETKFLSFKKKRFWKIVTATNERRCIHFWLKKKDTWTVAGGITIF